MKRRFVLTPEAKADLREILLDIAEDSPDTAERLRSEIYDGFQRLGQMPGIGHFHEELLDRRYRFWNFYSYVSATRGSESPFRLSPLCTVPGISSFSSVQGRLCESRGERYKSAYFGSMAPAECYTRRESDRCRRLWD